MIPKRIFYVWGANEPKGKAELMCLFSWFQNLKDFEIIEINDNSTEYFNFQEELKNNKWFKTVYDRKMWAYVADYIRIKTLYDNGGVYFDTDVMAIKDLSPLLDNPAFVGIQSYDRTEPAILGAEKGNPFLKQILDFYNNEIWYSSLYKCPDLFKHFLELNYGKQEYDFDNIDDEVRQYKDITLYPRKYLIPFSPAQIRKEDIRKISEDTYTIHWYKGSWSKPEIFYFLENKNKLSLKFLDEKCKLIKAKSEKGFQYNNIFERIFSIKDSYKKSKKYKIITILGMKIKYSVKI